MSSRWTISLRELIIQPEQARVAGTCADHNLFYMDSLCLKLVDNRKEDAMNKNNDEKLITRHWVRSQGDRNVSVHYCGHIFPENCVQPVTQLFFCVIGMLPVLTATSLSCRSRCRGHIE